MTSRKWLDSWGFWVLWVLKVSSTIGPTFFSLPFSPTLCTSLKIRKKTDLVIYWKAEALRVVTELLILDMGKLFRTPMLSCILASDLKIAGGLKLNPSL